MDSHSIWLHTLIENGPFLPALILAGIVGVFLEIKSTWPLLDQHSRTILLALSLSMVGIFTVAFAQYIVYIRVVEIGIWICMGAIVGLCRKMRCVVEEEVASAHGPRLLLLCGAFALIATSMNSRAPMPSIPFGRVMTWEGKLDFWTSDKWGGPVTSNIDTIEFSIYRKCIPANVTITWPDGSQEFVTIMPEQSLYFRHERESKPAKWYDENPKLWIEVTPTFVPANFLEGNNDQRALGVYITGLLFDSKERREYIARSKAKRLAE